MKKNLIILAMSILLMFCLIGCSSSIMLSEEDLSNTNKSEYSMFIELENGGSYRVVYHKDTKVMYVMSTGSYNYGNFTVMLNADGNPMLYEGR